MILLTLVVKAMTAVASSCNSVSRYFGEGSPNVQTNMHTQNAFFVCIVLLILTVSYSEGQHLSLLLVLQDNYCLVAISHSLCVQMLWLGGAFFCFFSHGIGLG